jgi:multicomponent Na+:H+ antiporter subunit G
MTAEMLGWLRDGVSWLLLLGGSFFLIVGATGLIRLRDFYARLHAAGVTDTGGAILILSGLAVQAGFSLATVKLGIILAVFLLTSPTAVHALASAAYSAGARPMLEEDRTGADRREPGA